MLERPPRAKAIDAYLGKVEEWVERTEGKGSRGLECHEKLVAMGYTGSERTTRRAVSVAKKLYRQGKHAGVPPVGSGARLVAAVRLG